MRKFISVLFVIAYAHCTHLYGQNGSSVILFPPTPNPAEEKCLVRMYLPESDEKAELRLISKTDSLVKSIPLTNIRGIQSAVVGLSELPKGAYTCQLFYKGIIAQSTPIYHSVIDAEAHSFDSAAIYSAMKDLELRVKAMELNITFLRDYNTRQDSMISQYQQAHGNDTITRRLIELNREVVRLRLKLESFEQLMRELTVLKVRNKLSENPMKKGNTYTLTRIYFNSSNADFIEKSTVELDELVEVLKEFPSIIIKIKGHTDNVGNYLANMALSKERAKNVYSYLIDKGIDPNRLSYDGYGSSMPFTDNFTEEDKAINRRVEFVIMKE